MSIAKVVEQVMTFFLTVLGKNAKVIGAEQTEDGWHATVEIIEESEYMRTRALDDIVGLYEVRLDTHIQVIGYKRISLRERDEIEATDKDE